MVPRADASKPGALGIAIIGDLDDGAAQLLVTQGLAAVRQPARPARAGRPIDQIIPFDHGDAIAEVKARRSLAFNRHLTRSIMSY